MQEVNWADLVAMPRDDGPKIPEGTYQASVINATAGRSSTGRPMLTVKFGVENGPNLNHTITFPDGNSKPGHANIFLSTLRNLGVTVDWTLANEATPDQVAERITYLGAPCTVVLKYEEYQGSPRLKVQSVRPSQIPVPLQLEV